MAEPLKATFFTFKHRDRAVLLPATLAAGVIVALIIGAWVGLNWRALSLIFETLKDLPSHMGKTGGELSEEQGIALFTGMMGMFASTMLLMFPLFIAFASYEAACLRWMIRGEAPGLFGLTLDHDTWRVWGVYWCWLVTQMAIGFASSIVMFPIMFFMMGDIFAQAPQEPDPSVMWALQLKMQALSLIQYIPTAIIAIRFSPAAATSIARRRFSFFEAWTVTSDRFWALFGSWVLLWVLLGIAYAGLFAATYGPLFGDLAQQVIAQWPDFPVETGEEAMRRAFSPTGLMMIGAAYAGGFVFWVLYKLLGFGVNARAAHAALEEGKIKEDPAD